MSDFKNYGPLQARDFVFAAAILFIVYVCAIVISVVADTFDVLDRMFSAPVYIASYVAVLLVVGTWRHLRRRR
jgi:steroid 5-alpha reductase family enzyme